MIAKKYKPMPAILLHSVRTFNFFLFFLILYIYSASICLFCLRQPSYSTFFVDLIQWLHACVHTAVYAPHTRIVSLTWLNDFLIKLHRARSLCVLFFSQDNKNDEDVVKKNCRNWDGKVGASRRVCVYVRRKIAAVSVQLVMNARRQRSKRERTSDTLELLCEFGVWKFN